MKKWALLIIVPIAIYFYYQNQSPAVAENKPRIAITFDDGVTRDMPGYTNQVWNQMILDHLAKHQLQSVFFAKGKTLDSDRGREILQSWNDAQHWICNHTYNHRYFNSDKVTLDFYQQDFLKADSMFNTYSNFQRMFRFPYLKEGNTVEKRDGFRAFLKKHDYKNGHVSVDASDWYVNQRLVNRLKEDSTATIDDFKTYYLDHLLDRANYYDQLAKDIQQPDVSHVLLLHHNLAAALFLDDLIQHYQNNGWEVIDASEAFQHPIYQSEPKVLPAGESIIWSLAKETGKFETQLRYPAEDSRYEKSKMDSLGL